MRSIREADSNIGRLSDGFTWAGIVDFIVILQEGTAFVGDGNQFIIKLGNGATPTETFTIIGGLRNASITLSNQLVNCSNLSTGRWRNLVENSGIAALSLSGNGFFTDSAAEESLCSLAFSGGANNYEIMLGNGDKISGAFIVSGYKRIGNINVEEEFIVTIESSGVISFTTG